MTARRWFWGLTLAVAAWMLLAVKWVDSANHVNFDLGANVFVPLLPVARVLTLVQNGIHRVTSDLAGPQGEQKDRATLQAENQRLNNQLYMLSNQYYEMKRLVDQLEHQRAAHPEVRFISANVAAVDQGAAGQLCTIDRGTTSGIKRGAIVEYDSVPLGKVIAEGPYSATVRLITDAARPMWVTAQLQRRTASGIVVIAETCQVHGTATGVLACDNVKAVQTIPPTAGDILVVHDKDWRVMEGAIIGFVSDVAHLEAQPLFYALTIRPAVDVRACPFVLVQAE